MFRITASQGSDSSHPYVRLRVGTTSLSFIQCSDSDRSVQIDADDLWLTARFRFVNGGGKSPYTHAAIGQILNFMQGPDTAEPTLPLIWQGVMASRRDEDFSIELSAKLAENCMSFGLRDPHGRLWEPGASAAITIPLDECPPPLRLALQQLPHAMLRDSQLLYDRHGFTPSPAC